MASLDFNASSITWTPSGGGAATLTAISCSGNLGAAQPDLTSIQSTEHQHSAGLSNPTVSVEILGVPTAPVHAAKGAIGITWADAGTTLTLANCVCTGRSVRGRIDDRVTTTITLRPCPT